MDNDYSKRELDHMFGDVHSKLDKILEQTTRHNGRMSKIERWQSYIQGALAIIGIIALPLLGWALLQVSDIDSKIGDGIAAALSGYEIEIK